MNEHRNKVFELLFYAVLFIVLFFINRPYDRRPVQEPAKITVESKVDKYDAISEQP
jgi:hypothetical protein